MYASETFSGAMLEILVHANIGRAPRDLHFATITIPPGLAIDELTTSDVEDWSDVDATRRLGDAWHAKRRTAVLLVPSAVTRLERNVVLNPAHPDFVRIKASKAKPVEWDPRLFRGR